MTVKKPAASAATKKTASLKAAATRTEKAAKPAKAAVAAAAAKAVAAKSVSGKPATVKPAAARPVAPKAHAPKPVAAKPAEKAVKPVAEVAKRVELHAVPKPAAEVKAEARPLELRKPTTQRQGFKTNEFIVYPAHGVGQIVAIEEQEVAGYKLELFVINFIKDKMTLRVPTTKVASVGMRKLAETPMVKRALETLKGRARIKRTMWSRRAQEYEAKINSGDIVAIAEVVRDLFRSDSQPEQSYSERQLYEAALDRLAREISAVQRITETEAVKEIEAALAKGPRRGPKPADEAEPMIEDEAA